MSLLLALVSAMPTDQMQAPTQVLGAGPRTMHRVAWCALLAEFVYYTWPGLGYKVSEYAHVRARHLHVPCGSWVTTIRLTRLRT